LIIGSSLAAAKEMIPVELGMELMKIISSAAAGPPQPLTTLAIIESRITGTVSGLLLSETKCILLSQHVSFRTVAEFVSIKVNIRTSVLSSFNSNSKLVGAAESGTDFVIEPMTGIASASVPHQKLPVPIFPGRHSGQKQIGCSASKLQAMDDAGRHGDN
jgi:hypothetical protein